MNKIREIQEIKRDTVNCGSSLIICEDKFTFLFSTIVLKIHCDNLDKLLSYVIEYIIENREKIHSDRNLKTYKLIKHNLRCKEITV
jgi:hypothetical protein